MSCGGLQVRSISRTRDSMSCKSASNAVALIIVAGMIVVLLLLLSRSFGSALLSVGACSWLDSLAASSSGSSGENARVLRAVSLEDPILVLVLPSCAAVAAADVSVVVVFVVGLVSLLACPVTRLDSLLVDVVCLLFSNRVFGLRLVSDWASVGINQMNEMRIRVEHGQYCLGKIKNGQGSLVVRGGV